MTGAYIQMAAALLFVILLILGAGFVFKKKNSRMGLMMNVVGYHSFGPKKGVAALKIGNEVLILGVTPNDMRLLKVFKDTELDLSGSSAFQSKLDKFKGMGVQ